MTRGLYSITVPSIALATLYLSVGEPNASQRIECRAVANLATLVAEPQIPATMVEDDEGDTCTFNAHMPPVPTTEGAAQKATVFFQKMNSDPSDEAAQQAFPQSVIEALITPLKEQGFDDKRIAAWTEVLRKETGTISDCAIKLGGVRAQVAAFSDVISCGADEDDTHFTIAAKLAGLTVTLLLPLA